MVGKNSLTDAVFAEIDVSLSSHETIKFVLRVAIKMSVIIYVLI